MISSIYCYRFVSSNSRRSDNLQSFIMQDEIMISQQDEEQRQSTINKTMSLRATPLLSDHVYVQHRNLNNNAAHSEQIRQLSDTSLNDVGNISKTCDEIPNNNIMYIHPKNTNSHIHKRRQGPVKNNFARSESEANCVNDKSYDRCITIGQKRIWDSSSYAQKRRAQELVNTQELSDSFHLKNTINPNKQNSPNQSTNHELNKRVQSPNHESYKMHDYLSSRNIGMAENFKYKTAKMTILISR